MTNGASKRRWRRSASRRRRIGWRPSSAWEWESTAGLHNVAFVVSRDGEVVGYQAKNQIPSKKNHSTRPTDGAGCSRSMGSRSGSPSATRGGATRRACAGRRPRRPSRLPPAAHRQRLHWHDHRTLGIPARPTTRSPWWRVASRTRSISPVSITRCATKTRRPVCSVPRGSAWRMCPTARNSCWCTTSTCRGQLGYAPGASTRPSIRQSEPAGLFGTGTDWYLIAWSTQCHHCGSQSDTDSHLGPPPQSGRLPVGDDGDYSCGLNSGFQATSHRWPSGSWK